MCSYFNFLYFIILTLYFNSKCDGDTDVPKVLEISLTNYNATNPYGEAVVQYSSIAPDSSMEIVVNDIPENVGFIIMQVHSFQINLTLSEELVPTRKTSVTGTNIGLWKQTYVKQGFFYLVNKTPSNVTFLAAVLGYTFDTPAPGGCNMEFDVEIAPYLQIKYNNDLINVEFAMAEPPEPMMVDMDISGEPVCHVEPKVVFQDVYSLHLPERDFSVDTYFRYIQRFLTVGSIVEHGVFVHVPVGDSETRRNFAAYPGTGTVYVVVAHTLTNSAAYVPIITYACDISSHSDSCSVLTTTVSKLTCAVVLFVGLFSCFCGHWYFRTHLFLSSLLFASVISYIVFSHFGTFGLSEDLLSASIGVGVAFGLIWVSLWCCYAITVLTILLPLLTLGYLFSASLFYAFTDNFEFLENDINYWATFGSLLFFVPILCLSLAENANIIATAIVGAYAAIIPIDHYIGSNLKYIVIDSIRRATNKKFSTALIDPPFQLYDALLVLVWLTLALVGILFQLWLVKGKAPFPASPNLLQRIIQCCQPSHVVGEKTPLLNGERWYASTGYNQPHGAGEPYPKYYPYNPYHEYNSV